jgi:hypothetical protein
MVRLSPVGYAACGVTTLIALTPLATYWLSGGDLHNGSISATEGSVHLAIDEQDVGNVEQDEPLEVCFLVTNTGSERLLLRQATQGRGSGGLYPLYTVSPGRTIAIIVRLNSNELGKQGRKHFRFDTSDVNCPELWLTVRGNPSAKSSADQLDR